MKGADEFPEIHRERLATRDRLNGLGFDLTLHGIYFGIESYQGLGQIEVTLSQCDNTVPYRLSDSASHIDDLRANCRKVGIEGSHGVVGHEASSIIFRSRIRG